MFRFKEICEIKADETRKVKTQKEEGYEKIKPETVMTIDEAKNFIEGLFGVKEG